MCFGGSSGGTQAQPVVQKTVNEIPEWMKKAGEEQYTRSKPLAERDYPVYSEDRLAEFSPETMQSFDMTKGNVGSWQAPFMQGMSGVQEGMGAVTPEQIAQYQNPYTQSVIDATTNQINRQHGTDLVKARGDMAKSGSYMNEDRRMVMENMMRESKDRNIAQTTAGLNLQGYNQALAAAEAAKARQSGGGQTMAQLAQQLSQFGMTDAAAVAGVGATKEGKTQQEMSLNYEDFLNQFYYPQEQLNWLGSQIQGIPYSSAQTTSGTQYINTPNQFAQTIGGLGGLAMGAGAMGLKFK